MPRAAKNVTRVTLRVAIRPACRSTLSGPFKTEKDTLLLPITFSPGTSQWLFNSVAPARPCRADEDLEHCSAGILACGRVQSQVTVWLIASVPFPLLAKTALYGGGGITCLTISFCHSGIYPPALPKICPPQIPDLPNCGCCAVGIILRASQASFQGETA